MRGNPWITAKTVAPTEYIHSLRHVMRGGLCLYQASASKSVLISGWFTSSDRPAKSIPGLVSTHLFTQPRRMASIRNLAAINTVPPKTANLAKSPKTLIYSKDLRKESGKYRLKDIENCQYKHDTRNHTRE